MFQNETNFRYLLAAALLVLAFVFVRDRKPETQNLSLKKAKDRKQRILAHDKRVNRYLHSVDEKRQLESSRVSIENYYYAPKIEDYNALIRGSGNRDQLLDYGVAMDQAGEAEQIHQQIATPSVFEEDIPEEMINQRVREKQERDEARYLERKAYIREFRENAKSAGYRVYIDDQMRVKKVKKVRKYQVLGKNSFD